MRRATAYIAVPVRRLSGSITSHVGAIHCWNLHYSRKLQKTLKPPILVV